MSTEILSAYLQANNVKKALDHVGLAQEEAARRLDVSYRHFNRVVLGQAEPTYLLVKKMEVVLGAEAAVLFPVRIKTRATRAVKPKRESK